MDIEKLFEERLREVDFINQEREFVSEVNKFLGQKVPEDPVLVRQILNQCMEYYPRLNRAKSKAKGLHYLAREVEDNDIPREVKSYGREARVKGRAAHYGYARELLEGMFEGLLEKIRICKKIMGVLDKEFEFE